MTANSILILVNNGSVDGTQLVGQKVHDASPTGAVFLAEEAERGYVPPRRRGCALAGEIAAARGFSRESTLIVQADADTIYSSGYLEALRQTSLTQGLGVMLDTCMGWSENFVRQHHDYIALCDEVDAEFDSLLSNNPTDVIVDDKGCAYRLSDYECWGGHQREYTVRGDEVFSESTRLYLRAKTHGARRYLCDAAMAHHSARRVHVEPALSFATAGFPRDVNFCARWQRAYNGPVALTDFANSAFRPHIGLALAARRAHLLGMFGMLPPHVARSLGQDSTLSTGLKDDAVSLPKRNVETLRNHPAVLLEDVFQYVDQIIFNL